MSNLVIINKSVCYVSCENLKFKIAYIYIECPKLDDQMSIFMEKNYTQEA